jgi:hypothetical protein
MTDMPIFRVTTETTAYYEAKDPNSARIMALGNDVPGYPEYPVPFVTKCEEIALDWEAFND